MNPLPTPSDPAVSPAGGPAHAPPRQEILLVEDEPAFRFLLAEVLRRAGYTVSEADNGRTALQHLRAHPVSLIVTDICMPDFDGIELLRQLRERPPVPAMVVMSGGMSGGAIGGDPSLFLKIARSLGASRTLAKPFSLDTLLKEVRELIGPPR